MRFIGVTMRVDHHDSIQEHRDAIDQRWYNFLMRCGLTPILFPNQISLVNEIINNIQLEGVILTGGNDLSILGGTASERDDLENHLLDWCIRNYIPLIGICRGMQLILNYFGNAIIPLQDHTKVQHRINLLDNSRIVNSYHAYGCKEIISDDIQILALSEDKVIEYIEHHNYPIKGIMWHPERNDEFDDNDIKLFHEHFKIN